MKLEYDLIKGETIPSFKDVIRVVESEEIDHYIITSQFKRFNPQTINSKENLNIILTRDEDHADILYFEFFDKNGNIVIPKFEAYSSSYGRYGISLFATTTCNNKVSLSYLPLNKLAALSDILYDGLLELIGDDHIFIYINSANDSIEKLNLTS